MASKQKRMFFTVGENLYKDIKLIEEYYEEPVSKLFLQNIVDLVKEKAKTLPADFRKKIA